MTERQIQTDILMYLAGRKDIASWRSNTGAAIWHGAKASGMVRFGIKGQADITGLIRPTGRFLAIEVKTKTGRQTKDQKRYQAMVTKYGGVYILARSVADVEAGL